jgi:hypothetical protein
VHGETVEKPHLAVKDTRNPRTSSSLESTISKYVAIFLSLLFSSPYAESMISLQNVNSLFFVADGMIGSILCRKNSKPKTGNCTIRSRSILKSELHAKSFPPFDFQAPFVHLLYCRRLSNGGCHFLLWIRPPSSRLWQFARLTVLHQVDVWVHRCSLLQVFSYLFLMIVLRYQYRIVHQCVSPSS